MINLLPQNQKKIVKKIRILRFARLIFIGLIILLLTSYLLLIPSFLSINLRFKIAQEQISSLQKNGAIVSVSDISRLQERSSVSKAKLLGVKSIQPTEYIEIIQGLTPSGIKINRFNTKDSIETIEISGISENRTLLQGFVKTLEDNERIESTIVPVSNFVKNKNSPFNVTIIFKKNE